MKRRVRLVLIGLCCSMSSCGLRFKENAPPTPYNPNELRIQGTKSLADLKLNQMNKRTNSIEVKFSRIIFESGSTLITDGSNVDFISDELVFNNSTIATFGDVLPDAPSGEKGKDGGEIKFFTLKASGQLTVLLRGQDGGSIDEKARVAGARAGDGGDTGYFLLIAQERKDFSFKAKLLPGNGGRVNASDSNQDADQKKVSSAGKGAVVRGETGKVGAACFQHQTIDRRICQQN